MGKIIDSVRVRCKTFVRGCEISRKGVMHKGIARGLAQSQKEGKKRGKVTTFSAESRRRLRECLASARPRGNCDYHVVGMCLTVPNHLGKLDDSTASKYADTFRVMFHAWAVAFVKHYKDVGMVWRVELQKSRMPHVHLVAYVPLGGLDDFTSPDGDTYDGAKTVYENYLVGIRFAHFRQNFKPVRFSWKHGVPTFAYTARRLWLKQLEHYGLNTPAASVRSVDCMVIKSDNAIHYLCDHESKRKQEQLGWQGRQWGILNIQALVFEETAPIELDIHHSGKFARIMARIEASRIASRSNLSPIQAKRLFKSLRLRYCVDSVRTSLEPKDLSALRVPVGYLGNALDAPTSDTLRNYSRIEYRPIGMPFFSTPSAIRDVPFPSLVDWNSDRYGEMTIPELVKRVRSGFFEPLVRDPLLVQYDALAVRLQRPLVQGVLAL